MRALPHKVFPPPQDQLQILHCCLHSPAELAYFWFSAGISKIAPKEVIFFALQTLWVACFRIGRTHLDSGFQLMYVCVHRILKEKGVLIAYQSHSTCIQIVCVWFNIFILSYWFHLKIHTSSFDCANTWKCYFRQRFSNFFKLWSLKLFF